MKSVKDWNMKDEVQQKIPEFAYMDLFSSYRDFISGIPLYLVISENYITNKLYMPCNLVIHLVSNFYLWKIIYQFWKVKAKALSCIAIQDIQ